MTDALITQAEVDVVLAARSAPAFEAFARTFAPNISLGDGGLATFADANKNKASRALFRGLVMATSLGAPATPIPPTPEKGVLPLPTVPTSASNVTPLAALALEIADTTGAKGDLRILLAVRDKVLLKGVGGLILQDSFPAELFRQALRLDGSSFPGGAQAAAVAVGIRRFLSSNALRSSTVSLASSRATGPGAIIVHTGELTSVMSRAGWWAVLAPLFTLVYAVTALGRSAAIRPELAWYLIHELGVETVDASMISSSQLSSLQVPEDFPSLCLVGITLAPPTTPFSLSLPMPPAAVGQKDPYHSQGGRGFGGPQGGRASQDKMARQCTDCGERNHWKNACRASEAVKTRWQTRQPAAS